MAEVEKLKQQRREAAAAKREAGGGESAMPEVAAPEADRVVEAAPSGALAMITSAEEKAAKLLTEIAEVSALIAAAADVAAVDAAATRQAAALGVLGQLSAMMDEIDLGEIEDEEARGAARARRKTVNKRCALASSGDVEVDGDIAAASFSLKKELLAARSKIK